MIVGAKRHPQEPDIRIAVDVAVNAVQSLGEDSAPVDREALVRELQTLISVWSPEATELVEVGHRPWLSEARDRISWDYWDRFRLYLEQRTSTPPQVIDHLHRVTDRILDNLQNPQAAGKWDRRGMVVGQVQSGKTANYIALICKAADAGYKLIVVLAGVHNSLRSQTQLRLDEGFLGRKSKIGGTYGAREARVGVGLVPHPKGFFSPHSLTTSNADGDFTHNVAQSIAPFIGRDAVLLVVKKHTSVLENLISFIEHHVEEQGCPVLVIDDEADHASIHTRKLDRDPNGEFRNIQQLTAINGKIRRFLNAFSRSAYVGYTATPFANIFIPPDAVTLREGRDLFPRHFIINLHPPSNYIGPPLVFGVGNNTGLPIVEDASDAEPLIPASHKSTLLVNALPESLKEAIRVFCLSCAARTARGQIKVHNSMLIHVTRFKNVQKQVHELVLAELQDIKRRLEFGDGERLPSLVNEFEILWEKQFASRWEVIHRKLGDSSLKPLSWEQVAPHLCESTARIALKLINGTEKDVLDYFENEDGISVIAIGGDKLSRGLTLEGLTVSYYLRAARMYDTLMQMGRWFGYRPGYGDLCRVYTTPELALWYNHITQASEELRYEFDRMAGAKMTPEQFGLRVKTHPGGLAVTSAGKMRYGVRVKVSYDIQLYETSKISRDPSILAGNRKAAENLITRMGAHEGSREGHYVWRLVPTDLVMDYLLESRGDPEYYESNTAKLAEYISLKGQHGELIEWTVILINLMEKGRSRATLGGLSVGLVERTPAKDDTKTIHIRNRRLISEHHEALDLASEEYADALRRTQEHGALNDPGLTPPDSPSGHFARLVRPASRGLLLIYPLDPSKVFDSGDPRAKEPIVGFALSFPQTGFPSESVEYLANSVYLREELSQDEA